MCDPLTITLIAAGSAALGTVQAVENISGAQAANDAAIEAYNRDIQAARSKALIDQQNTNIATQQEQLGNKQEERQAEQESMTSNAAAEAMSSATGVAGNTAQRAAAVTDINTLNREGAYAARGEGITAQHMMNSLGIQETYKNQVSAAEANANAAWKPMGGQVLSAILGGTGTAVSLFGAGAGGASAIGKSAGVSSSSELAGKAWNKSSSLFIP